MDRIVDPLISKLTLVPITLAVRTIRTLLGMDRIVDPLISKSTLVFPTISGNEAKDPRTWSRRGVLMKFDILKHIGTEGHFTIIHKSKPRTTIY